MEYHVAWCLRCERQLHILAGEQVRFGHGPRCSGIRVLTFFIPVPLDSIACRFILLELIQGSALYCSYACRIQDGRPPSPVSDPDEEEKQLSHSSHYSQLHPRSPRLNSHHPNPAPRKEEKPKYPTILNRSPRLNPNLFPSPRTPVASSLRIEDDFELDALELPEAALEPQTTKKEKGHGRQSLERRPQPTTN